MSNYVEQTHRHISKHGVEASICSCQPLPLQCHPARHHAGSSPRWMEICLALHCFHRRRTLWGPSQRVSGPPAGKCGPPRQVVAPPTTAWGVPQWLHRHPWPRPQSAGSSCSPTSLSRWGWVQPAAVPCPFPPKMPPPPHPCTFSRIVI